MDEREFSPEEIAKAMKLCYSDLQYGGAMCDECVYRNFMPNCTHKLLADAVRLLDKTFGGGDSDGD